MAGNKALFAQPFGRSVRREEIKNSEYSRATIEESIKRLFHISLVAIDIESLAQQSNFRQCWKMTKKLEPKFRNLRDRLRDNLMRIGSQEL